MRYGQNTDRPEPMTKLYTLLNTIGRAQHHIVMIILCVFLLPIQSWAQESCKINDRTCVLNALESSTVKIEKKAWRDQTYRELAKTYAADGHTDKAIEIISKIETPDTQALTIRGIGMAAAKNDLSKKEYNRLFTKLRIAAEKIKHQPSYAIALTYVAMAQAFAGDNDGAWETASDMANAALRHKAYGETAEIQAEMGNFSAAMKSIGFIESEAYRNKAYGHISKILADHGHLQHAYDAALSVTNAYKKSSSIQYLLNVQKPQDKAAIKR